MNRDDDYTPYVVATNPANNSEVDSGDEVVLPYEVAGRRIPVRFRRKNRTRMRKKGVYWFLTANRTFEWYN
jgi:hypothetical protein